ncbi:MAG: 4'-phosphopantetheinyl transferase superfamily protein [Gemmatimonadaceae bacterium]
MRGSRWAGRERAAGRRGVVWFGGTAAVAVATAEEALGRAWALDDPARVSAAPVAGRDRRAERAASRLAAARAAARLALDLPPVPGVVLSVSHRAGRGAAIAARGDAGLGVGVDLELAGAVPPERGRYFLTVGERDAFAGRDLAEAWALKEAAWKALRLGDDTPLCALELALGVDHGVAAVAVRGRSRRAGSRLLVPWPGFVLAALWVEGAS